MYAYINQQVHQKQSKIQNKVRGVRRKGYQDEGQWRTSTFWHKDCQCYAAHN